MNLVSILISCPIHSSFKTDVFGVYDRPPSEPGATLLKEIGVQSLRTVHCVSFFVDARFWIEA